MAEQITEVLDAKQLAGQNYKKGYNCAESVIRAFRDKLKLNIPDEALKMATGFGGGLGHAGCLCGALAGSSMILSLLQGRLAETESRDPAYQSAKEFHDIFKKHFGATCCRVLNRSPYDSPEHLRTCLKITGGTAELLDKYLQDYHIVKDGND